MSAKQMDPVQKRNVIFLAGITTLLVSILLARSVQWFCTLELALMWIGGAAISGVIFAVGLAQVAEIALKSPVEPWYARPCAARLIGLLFSLVFGGRMLHEKFMQRNTLTPRTIDMAYLVSVLGATLIWIVLLQWVSYDD